MTTTDPQAPYAIAAWARDGWTIYPVAAPKSLCVKVLASHAGDEEGAALAERLLSLLNAAPPMTGAAGEGNPHLTSQYPPINDARLAMIREWVIEARRVHHYDPQNHSAHHYAYAVPELLQALAVASTEAAEAKERVGIQGVRIADLSKRNEILADDSHSSGREIAALRARLQEETRAAAEARERAAELMAGLLMEWMDETEPHSLTYDSPDEFLKDQGVHRKFFQLKAAACGLGWPLHEATIGISAALPLVGEEGKEGVRS